MSKDTHVSLDGRSRSGRISRGCVGPVCCLFSTAKSRNPGQGRVHYRLVRQVGEDGYAVRGVDGDFLPFGEESLIPADDLINHYTPEVAVFEERVLPSARRHNYQLKGTDRAHGYRRSLLAIDEANVRGLFELGLEYIIARRMAKGRTLLGELLRVKTPFPGKDQFLFNEFGIRLRRLGHYEGAVVCYRRALKYADRDEHLCYNLARAYYEQGQWWDCMNELSRCFGLDPDLPVARDLVILIHALAGNTALRLRYNKPPIPEGVARRAAVLCENLFAADERAHIQARTRTLQEEERALENAERALDQRRDTGLWLPGRDAVGM